MTRATGLLRGAWQGHRFEGAWLEVSGRLGASGNGGMASGYGQLGELPEATKRLRSGLCCGGFLVQGGGGGSSQGACANGGP